MATDFMFGLSSAPVIYDIETFKSQFTMVAKQGDRRFRFEISRRYNDYDMVLNFLDSCQTMGVTMVGFNNLGFDYPVLHHMYRGLASTSEEIHELANAIIAAHGPAKFKYTVWPSDQVVPQMDLYKIHHFNNKARTTSLKALEFMMQMDDIEDTPHEYITMDHLNDREMDATLSYNNHDVTATEMFLGFSQDKLQLRRDLSAQYGKDFTNYSDVTIGSEIFIHELEKVSPGSCYTRQGGKRKPRQTKRAQVRLADCILPSIQFQHPEFQRVLTYLKQQVITETKGVFKDLYAEIQGLKYVFGQGGIHASVSKQMITADDEFIIEDWDVASYYPNLAIKNRFYPEHLGETFCDVYEDLYQQRKYHKDRKKESALSASIEAALKLALNGTFGKSNDEYSPFYDIQFLLSITINGQLLLCKLAETLIQLDSLTVIQANTDGLTIRYPRAMKEWVHSVCRWWEDMTQLELESAEYNRMMVRDVNNYWAEYTNGDIKRKGAYGYVTPMDDPNTGEVQWHKDPSMLVVPKAVEKVLTQGMTPEQAIKSHDIIHDFMIRARATGSDKIIYGESELGKIARYYVSTDGDFLVKRSKPKGPEGSYKRKNKLTDAYYQAVLDEVGDAWDERIHTKNKSRYETTYSDFCAGQTVQVCNTIPKQMSSDVNYDWYINEVNKLLFL